MSNTNLITVTANAFNAAGAPGKLIAQVKLCVERDYEAIREAMRLGAVAAGLAKKGAELDDGLLAKATELLAIPNKERNDTQKRVAGNAAQFVAYVWKAAGKASMRRAKVNKAKPANKPVKASDVGSGDDAASRVATPKLGDVIGSPRALHDFIAALVNKVDVATWSKPNAVALANLKKALAAFITE